MSRNLQGHQDTCPICGALPCDWVMKPNENREVIAKIIDPGAWAKPVIGDDDSVVDQPYRQHQALAKADQILNLNQ